MAAKKYTPKDINKNGKLDQWEINKYKLINKGKPQMGTGEQGSLKPKFLKGIFSKDDGSMSTFGNVANAIGPLAGLVGIGKSITDLFRGGNPAMMNKPMKVKNPFSAESKIERLGKKEQKAKNKKTSVAARSVMKQQLKISKAKNKMNSVRDAYSNKPNNYVSAAQRKAVHASKKDGGKGNPNKKK